MNTKNVPHLLVATLGTTWAVIPEVYGIFTDLYGQKRPGAVDGVSPPDRIVIVSTGKAWAAAEANLTEWAKAVGVPISQFLASEPDLAQPEDVRRMRELIFRVVLQCRENSTRLSCSLAGGRKTMSADMQEAARTFGCDHLLHVLSDGTPSDWPTEFKHPQPALFLNPLREEILRYLLPVVLPGSDRDDALDVEWQGRPPVSSERFPPSPVGHDTTELTDELQGRRADHGLLSNFIAEVEKDERHENWRSLYRLPPRLIRELRETVVSPEHRELLRNLPKADLHRHLGGVLALEEQKIVAGAIWDHLSAEERENAIRQVCGIDWEEPDASWRSMLKMGNRPANVAAVFQLHSLDEIQENLYPPALERTALKVRHRLGFGAYELPGELSGSAVLGHPAAIDPTVRLLVAGVQAEGLAYVEVRGSPHKYDPENPSGWLQNFATKLQTAASSCDLEARFVWIADRRQPEAMPKLVQAVADCARDLNGFLVGIDVAGDENFNNPKDLSQYFTSVFRECMPVTIHAGEGESAENIWEAAYHLHADRIGHGLSLSGNPALRDRFRDRDICLELCPTSNREVVGFYDPAFPESAQCEAYPALDLWNSGVPLTLCTDNPGISRCTLADEYLAASRMCGGMTLWDALAMMKQGFRKAFADATTRERILKAADRQIGSEVLSYFKNR